MKSTGTLRFRLSLLFSLFLTIMAVVILSSLLKQIEDNMLAEVDGLLYEQVDNLSSFVEEEVFDHEEEHDEDREENDISPEEVLEILNDEIFDHLRHSPLQNEAYIIINEDGDVALFKSLSDELAKIDLEELGEHHLHEVATISHPALKYPLRYLASEIFDEHELVIITSLEDYSEQVRDIRIYFITAALLMIFIGGGIAWFTIGRSMKGVLLVTNAANKFGRGDLKSRVSWNGKGNEIEDLIAHFNHMASQTEALIKEMSEVTNNIAHDLRTPVTRMRGLAENCLIDNNDNALAASVIEECERQAAIIEDILSLAESEAGVLKLKLIDTDLNELVADIVEIYEDLAEKEGCQISYQQPSEPIRGKIDRHRIQRVLSNLFDNAIKYCPQAKISIQLSRQDDHIELRITDNGPGIDKEFKDKIFNRFFRADTARNTPGSGLGLSLAQSYVRSHQGELSLEDSRSGASFLITLPLID